MSVLATMLLFCAQGAAPTEVNIGELSIAELLARMPASPWVKNGAKWELADIPEEIGRRVETVNLTDDEWRMLLLSGDVIHTRARWPAEEPLVVWIREPAWFRCTRITARALEPSLGEVTADNSHLRLMCASTRDWQLDTQRELRLGALPAGTQRVVFDVTVEQRDFLAATPALKPATRLLWRSTVDIPVEAIPSIDQALPPTSLPEQEASIRRSLSVAFTVQSSAPCFTVGGKYDEYPELRGLGLSLDVELRHLTDVVMHYRLLADRAAGDGLRSTGLEAIRWIDYPRDFPRDSADAAGWSLRVRGTSQGLLSLWEVDRWWSGEFVMPLSEAFEHALK